MTRPRWLMPVLLLLCVQAVGCAKLPFAYNHARWAVVPKLKAVTHFTDAQKAEIDTGFDRYMAWHRRAMLPKYARLLRDLAALVRPDVTQAQVAGQRQAWLQAWEATMEPALPVMAKVLAQLDRAQADAMQAHFAEEVADAQKQLAKKTRAERLDARDDKFLDTVDDWCGGLNRAQEQQLRPLIRQIPLQDTEWLAERKQMREQLVQQVRDHAPEDRLVTLLHTWWIGRRYQTDAQTGPPFDRFAVALVHVLDADQRRHLRQQLTQWADECEQLSKQ